MTRADGSAYVGPMDTPTLHRRLRRVFDARVFNHGDYNVVYGQPSGSSSPLVIGYRHQPLEMLLCPFDPTSTPDDHDRRAPGVAEDDPHGPVTEASADRADVVGVGLANVATVADTGSGYQVETVTGFRTWFDVPEHTRVPVGDLTEDGTAELDQAEDATDFHAFMTAFMDELDRLYATPETDATDVTPPDLHGV